MSTETKAFFYKGFMSVPQWSEEDGVWYGGLDNCSDLVNYEAEDYSDCYKEFVNAVEDYLAFKKDVDASRSIMNNMVRDILRSIRDSRDKHASL